MRDLDLIWPATRRSSPNLRSAGHSGPYTLICEEPDNLGSVTGLVNTAGTKVNNYTYDPYGIDNGSTESVTNPYRYTSGQFDSTTGLYKLGIRYYDPTLGRFTQQGLPRVRLTPCL